MSPIPVEQLSWDDATEFCARLAKHTHCPYRLPTEAEWEYACRAGTTTPFYFGNTLTKELANYRAAGITPVDHFEIANAFGLSDMHGNVWEWCADSWHHNYKDAPTDGNAWTEDGDDSGRVLRGGSWLFDSRSCSSACRLNSTREIRSAIIGFRVSCSASKT